MLTLSVAQSVKAHCSANCLVSCQANPEWTDPAAEFYLLYHFHDFDGLSWYNLH